MEASTNFRDDPRMATKLEAAHKYHEAWKMMMSTHAKEVSWLEINLREEEMRGEKSRMLRPCHVYGVLHTTQETQFKYTLLDKTNGDT